MSTMPMLTTSWHDMQNGNSMNTRNFIFGLLLAVGSAASAHDFAATVDGQRFYFEITNSLKKTVAVTYKGCIADRNAPEVRGVAEIPAKVKHNDVVYEVNAIGRKAFANADELKGIVIPPGIESIGDFAFEDCDSLQSVVFPGNPVSFGQGTFFKCRAISDVTMGSDWKSVDLTMFRWSSDLVAITIPAKIEKIKGIKKLLALRSVSVDPNNKAFMSQGGLLYSKDGATLYACPRAYEGKVEIAEGTKAVLDGALIDCPAVTAIDLPSTLHKISFRETSRMKGLQTIVVRNPNPFFTGYEGADGRFFFLLANPKAAIIVGSSAKNGFLGILATGAGEYSVEPGTIPYEVRASELPAKKNIKGVRNFNKY